MSCAVFILIFGGVYYYFQDNSSKNETEAVVVTQENAHIKDSEETTNYQTSAVIFIHVCGAVKKPGVYEVMVGSRICDAINAAGGLTKKAADSDINQAELLVDGQQVYIPYKRNTKDSTLSESSSTVDSSKININTATSAELTTLPGIGDAKAASILQYREENGNFASIEDIKNVSGIKDGLYTQIEAYITV